MEADVKLTFVTSKSLATGTNVSSVRFTPNSAYDVDPVLGSTSTPGFSEWATLYGFYRVVAFSYKVDFVNTETTRSCAVYTVATNADPGTSLSYIAGANPMSKMTVLAPLSGQNRASLSGSHKVADILGSDAPETADSYRATVAASPADLVWLGCGAQTLSGNSFTTGNVEVLISITMFVRFYDRSYKTS